jgi:hypothetical protein
MDERFYQEIERQLSGMSAGESGRADLPFLSMVQHVRAFAVVAGRFPDSTSADRHEALMGRWLLWQGEMATKGVLGQTLHSFADAALGPGWVNLGNRLHAASGRP